MKPIAPLMIEHRLIEQMVCLLQKLGNRPNVNFLLDAVDFFRSYADLVHHGKEEQILFSELGKKALSGEHRKMLATLLNEHVLARKAVSGLHVATKRYSEGDISALSDIKASIKVLVELYPAHIEKEDRHFFIPVLAYFSEDEQRLMLQRFLDFDRAAEKEKYITIVDNYSKIDS
jgi:hemerythrin-like domain-containing protein